jgi:hypothetical protein
MLLSVGSAKFLPEMVSGKKEKNPEDVKRKYKQFFIPSPFYGSFFIWHYN